MKCPCCSVELVRTKYEGLSVFRCEKCSGYLVARHRMDGIKRARGKSKDELKSETVDEAQADTQETLRCPKCLVAMKKNFLKEPAAFYIDLCNECELVWFDGGELARFQLAWEISAKGRDTAEFQRRMQEMSPEAKQEFEENIQNLKEQESPFWGGLREAFVEALFTGGRHRWRRS